MGGDLDCGMVAGTFLKMIDPNQEHAVARLKVF